jgi:hypothetical protein
VEVAGGLVGVDDGRHQRSGGSALRRSPRSWTCRT